MKTLRICKLFIMLIKLFHFMQQTYIIDKKMIEHKYD